MTKFLAVDSTVLILLPIANYNNDIGDFWKYLDRGDKPLKDISEAIRLGINYVVYAMSH